VQEPSVTFWTRLTGLTGFLPVCIGLAHPVNPVNPVERGELNSPGIAGIF
jgi:hypothetical protein